LLVSAGSSPVLRHAYLFAEQAFTLVSFQTANRNLSLPKAHFELQTTDFHFANAVRPRRPMLAQFSPDQHHHLERA
jgi:hypothetical protein